MVGRMGRRYEAAVPPAEDPGVLAERARSTATALATSRPFASIRSSSSSDVRGSSDFRAFGLTAFRS
jgi:hypothetical protein